MAGVNPYASAPPKLNGAQASVDIAKDLHPTSLPKTALTISPKHLASGACPASSSSAVQRAVSPSAPCWSAWPRLTCRPARPPLSSPSASLRAHRLGQALLGLHRAPRTRHVSRRLPARKLLAARCPARRAAAEPEHARSNRRPTLTPRPSLPGSYGGIVDNPAAPSPEHLLVEQKSKIPGALGWRKDVMDVIGKEGELQTELLRSVSLLSSASLTRESSS